MQLKKQSMDFLSDCTLIKVVNCVGVLITECLNRYACRLSHFSAGQTVGQIERNGKCYQLRLLPLNLHSTVIIYSPTQIKLKNRQ